MSDRPELLRSVAPSAVELRGIRKSFDGTPVLVDVDFEVRGGEVHALAGGNGAGKSTLMKILQGVYSLDAGEILLDGRPVRFASIHEAQAAGVGMVFQEFSLIPTLTVARNVCLNAEARRAGVLLRDGDSVRRTREVFAEMGVDVDPHAVVAGLGTAYWQLTEIAKALAKDARILVMDEPTASLARHEAEALFDLVRRLKERGIAIIYISHRMEEIYRIADRITVLRDGRRLFTRPIADVTPHQVVEGIVGHSVEGALSYRDRAVARAAEPLLSVRHLQAEPRLRDISLDVHPGEIVGLAGLMGSGRTELAQCLFGVIRPQAGQILVRGRPVEVQHPRRAIEAGLALVPEDRRAQGLVLEHSVRDNLLLPLLPQLRRGVFVEDGKGRGIARQLIERFNIKAANPARPVRLLSGGNQQKVVLAKWLGTEPDILVMDEPTAGVDIGTKSEILEQVRRLADDGKGVLLISSEYAELLAVADRVLVLRDGVISRELARAEIADEEFLQLQVQGVPA
jgi:ribose transport system ATP-binding protein